MMRATAELWLVVLASAALALSACSDDDNNNNNTPDSFIPSDAGSNSSVDGPAPDTTVPHKTVSLQVAHVNDTHSQLEGKSLTLTFDIQGNQEQTGVVVGGYPRLIGKLKALRANNSALLTLHAGDALQGTLYFVKHQEKADLDMLNLMQLDAFVVGNHEFDRGPQLAASFIDGATFPVLGANVDASNEPLLKDKIKAYVVKEVNGEKVAVLGLSTPDTPQISSPGSSVTFGDPVARAKAMVQEVEGTGINKIILLSHLGFDEDQKLASAVEGIDVIVGGHSHTLLGDTTALAALGIGHAKDYPTLVKDPAGNDVCIVQAWSATQALGILEVDLDKDGFVKKCTGKTLLPVGDTFTQFDPVQKKVVEVDATKKAAIEQLIQASPVIEVVTEDAAALAKVATYKQAVDALMAEEVAGVDVSDDLWNVRIPGMTHPTAGVLASGSHVAPHVAASMLFKASQLAPAPDIAVINAGGVRADVPKGKLTMGTVFKVLPYFNTLYLVKVTGKQLGDTFDAVVGNAVENNKSAGFPYVAGARYTADMTKPAGQRIALEVDAGGTWSAIDPAKEYTIVTISFLAGGGDGYAAFAGATFRKDLAYAVDSDVFVEYAKDKKTLTQPAETGVTLIKAP